MELGFFIMPSHPPERPLRQGHEFDLQALRWADEFGYSEAWVGEHHSCPWEPNPAPDLLVAQALRETCRMRIGTGGFLVAPTFVFGEGWALDLSGAVGDEHTYDLSLGLRKHLAARP